MIDNIVDKYINEAKKEDDEINWSYHFEQFGGEKDFLNKTGINKQDLDKYMKTGITPESARKQIRSAVAKRLIHKYKK